jgi:hypothetical protein
MLSLGWKLRVVAIILPLIALPSLLLARSGLAQAPGQLVQPAPPRVFLDTTYAAPSGRTIAVASGGDFQAALKAAQPGDVITLAPGAVFTGNFSLPKKAENGWIVVRSGA